MGISEGLHWKKGVDSRVGTIVWVQRKNRSWWPGRVVGPNELSPSHLLQPRAGTPVKLFGKDDATVDWFNLEKSKCVKAFRCGEFDDCIERAESSQANPSQKFVKYACREDAILHALELEKQELQKKHDEPEKERAVTICRAKRSRCVYLPTESKKLFGGTVSYPKCLQVSSSPFRMGNCSLQSGSAEENTFSRSKDSDSSENDSLDPESDEGVTQLSATELRNSGNYDVQSGKMKCKEHVELGYFSDFPPNDQNLPKRPGDVIDRNNVRFKHETCNIVDPWSSNSASRNHSRIEFHTKSEENLVWGVKTTSQSALGNHNQMEDLGCQSFDPAYIGNHNQMETTLVDVDLMVQASYQGEHVPLVSLKSILNGKVIVGQPMKIEASVDGSSETPLHRKDDMGNKLVANDTSTMLQPVWRTSRRTPVCYVPLPQPSSTFEFEKVAQACHNSDHLKARENSSTPAQDFRMKPLNKPCMASQKTTFSTIAAEQKPNGNGGELQRARQSCMIDGQDVLLKSEETANRVTCIPVNLTFKIKDENLSVDKILLVGSSTVMKLFQETLFFIFGAQVRWVGEAVVVYVGLSCFVLRLQNCQASVPDIIILFSCCKDKDRASVEQVVDRVWGTLLA
ncbi:hypothetical protein F0562_011934 [Nyssa sinensis]|uniref:PWWP domain-containing protein n=1 Tax=Nyssa sinensis TaxID=561372 RepID=A0A5J4ZT33_9ASTE|nr:hypothetical protein F0562_011934 [Nyssa sinensis]